MDDYAMYDHPCNTPNEFCKNGQKYQVSKGDDLHVDD